MHTDIIFILKLIVWVCVRPNKLVTDISILCYLLEPRVWYRKPHRYFVNPAIMRLSFTHQRPLWDLCSPFNLKELRCHMIYSHFSITFKLDIQAVFEWLYPLDAFAIRRCCAVVLLVHIVVAWALYWSLCHRWKEIRRSIIFDIAAIGCSFKKSAEVEAIK